MAAACTVLMGCGALTHTGAYDPSAFAPWRIAQEWKLEGRALILTAANDDAFVYSGRPRGFVGSATTLRLPLGVIVREAAVRVFGDLFLGGAKVSNDASRLEGCRAVITPRFVAFSHQYGWSTNRFELSVRVALLDAGGQVAFEKSYDSGQLEVPAGVYRASPARPIDRAAHVAIQQLMLQAAADVRTHLEGRSPPPGDEPHGAEEAQPRARGGVAASP